MRSPEDELSLELEELQDQRVPITGSNSWSVTESLETAKYKEASKLKSLYRTRVLAPVAQEIVTRVQPLSKKRNWTMQKVSERKKIQVEGTSTYNPGYRWFTFQFLRFDGFLIVGKKKHFGPHLSRSKLFIGFGPQPNSARITIFGGVDQPRQEEVIPRNLVERFYGDNATLTPGGFPIGLEGSIGQMQEFMDGLTVDYFAQQRNQLRQEVQSFMQTNLPNFFTT